jgi:ectoine hydroxylase-related dioxygenase (phytanoyl-CoA dioxygenase family)
MDLTSEQVEQFKRDGFIILDRIISDETVSRAREAVERCFSGEYGCDRRPAEVRRELARLEDGEAKIGQIVHGRLLDTDLWEIMGGPTIGRLIAGLTESPLISLTEDQLFKKPPHSPHVAMHQDYPYQTFASNADLTSCWIALTDVTPETSPLEYIRGSHTWPTAPFPSRFSDGGDDHYMEAADPIRPDGWEDDLVQVIVPAGGGAVHHTKTMHGSRANTSDGARVAIAMHHAMESCRLRTDNYPWHESMWKGTREGGLVANEFMPVVYPVV